MKLEMDHRALLTSTGSSDEGFLPLINHQKLVQMKWMTSTDSLQSTPTKRVATWNVPDFQWHCYEHLKDQSPQRPSRRASMDDSNCSSEVGDESTLRRPSCLRSGRYSPNGEPRPRRNTHLEAPATVSKSSVTFSSQVTIVYVIRALSI